MQPAPAPPVQAQPQPPQTMQPMAAYQPQPKFLDKYGAYSFTRWLMIGVVLVVIAALFTQITTLTGPPNPYDYTDAEKLTEDQYSHTTLENSLDAFANILSGVGMGLIAYALLRESYDGDAHHTAVRVTAIILGMLALANVAGRGLGVL